MQIKQIMATSVIDYTEQVVAATLEGYRQENEHIDFSPRMIGYYFVAQFVKDDEPATPATPEVTEAPRKGRKSKDAEPAADVTTDAQA